MRHAEAHRREQGEPGALSPWPWIVRTRRFRTWLGGGDAPVHRFIGSTTQSTKISNTIDASGLPVDPIGVMVGSVRGNRDQGQRPAPDVHHTSRRDRHSTEPPTSRPLSSGARTRRPPARIRSRSDPATLATKTSCRSQVAAGPCLDGQAGQWPRTSDKARARHRRARVASTVCRKAKHTPSGD